MPALLSWLASLFTSGAGAAAAGTAAEGAAGAGALGAASAAADAAPAALGTAATQAIGTAAPLLAESATQGAPRLAGAAPIMPVASLPTQQAVTSPAAKRLLSLPSSSGTFSSATPGYDAMPIGPAPVDPTPPPTIRQRIEGWMLGPRGDQLTGDQRQSALMRARLGTLVSLIANGPKGLLAAPGAYATAGEQAATAADEDALAHQTDMLPPTTDPNELQRRAYMRATHHYIAPQRPRTPQQITMGVANQPYMRQPGYFDPETHQAYPIPGAQPYMVGRGEELSPSQKRFDTATQFARDEINNLDPSVLKDLQDPTSALNIQNPELGKTYSRAKRPLMGERSPWSPTVRSAPNAQTTDAPGTTTSEPGIGTKVMNFLGVPSFGQSTAPGQPQTVTAPQAEVISPEERKRRLRKKYGQPAYSR